jgi:hypothetical protein
MVIILLLAYRLNDDERREFPAPRKYPIYHSFNAAAETGWSGAAASARLHA